MASNGVDVAKTYQMLGFFILFSFPQSLTKLTIEFFVRDYLFSFSYFLCSFLFTDSPIQTFL